MRKLIVSQIFKAKSLLTNMGGKKGIDSGRFFVSDQLDIFWNDRIIEVMNLTGVGWGWPDTTICFSDRGEYYAKFVLRECQNYAQHRDLLRGASPKLSLPEILGTEKGLQALAKFLEASGAFMKTGRPRRETEPLAQDDKEADDGVEEEEEEVGN
ncbi:hypothetical protein K438DRAFT_1801119 [Mycena galopus ATCC 62051]|nr:hypothetical protein K438DRAFT_1801119 [Mycena galopus ATCC 62051]